MKTQIHRCGSASRTKLVCLTATSLLLVAVGCNAKVEFNHQDDDAGKLETIVRLNDEIWYESQVHETSSQRNANTIAEKPSFVAYTSETTDANVEQDTVENKTEVQPDDTAEVTADSFANEVTPSESTSEEAMSELPPAEEVNLTSENKLLPQDRPDWVAAPDSYSGDTHTLVVTTPTGNSVQECEAKFAEVAYQRFVAYAKDKLEIDVTRIPKITKEWVADQTLTSEDKFFVDRTVDGGITYSGWTKLIIGPDTRSAVQEFHRQSQWLERSGSVGTLFLGMILCFGVAHLGLQLFTGKQSHGTN